MIVVDSTRHKMGEGDICGRNDINKCVVDYHRITKNDTKFHTFTEIITYSKAAYNLIVYFDMDSDSACCIMHDNYLKRVGEGASDDLKKSFSLLDSSHKRKYQLIYELVHKRVVG